MGIHPCDNIFCRCFSYISDKSRPPLVSKMSFLWKSSNGGTTEKTLTLEEQQEKVRCYSSTLELYLSQLKYLILRPFGCSIYRADK